MNSRLTPLVLFLTLLSAASCNRYVSFGGYAQGGTYSVTLNMKGVKAPLAGIKAAVDSILVTVDTSLSGYNPGSQLSRFNAGEAVEQGDCFRRVLEFSQKYAEITGGALDVWSAPLFDAWGFGFRTDSLPGPERVQEALALSREHKVLNFNAVAQGFTADEVARYLHSVGARDMLVDIGEIYCSGVNRSGKGWRVGIDTPADGNNTPGASLSGIWQSDGGSHGIVTSGNYRKYYVRDGRKYAHTVDPRTGYPVQHNLLSATVVAPTSADADALATFFMVIGFDEARQWVLDHDDIDACLITSEEIWRSPGF